MRPPRNNPASHKGQQTGERLPLNSHAKRLGLSENVSDRPRQPSPWPRGGRPRTRNRQQCACHEGTIDQSARQRPETVSKVTLLCGCRHRFLPHLTLNSFTIETFLRQVHVVPEAPRAKAPGHNRTPPLTPPSSSPPSSSRPPSVVEWWLRCTCACAAGRSTGAGRGRSGPGRPCRALRPTRRCPVGRSSTPGPSGSRSPAGCP